MNAIDNYSIKTKLRSHTQSSIKCHEPGIIKLARTFNDLCKELEQLKQQGRAPQNSVVPCLIETCGLFDLDVDDNIWQDVENNRIDCCGVEANVMEAVDVAQNLEWRDFS